MEWHFFGAVEHLASYLPAEHFVGVRGIGIAGCYEITLRMQETTVLASAIIKHQGQRGKHQTAVVMLLHHVALMLLSGNSITLNLWFPMCL